MTDGPYRTNAKPKIPWPWWSLIYGVAPVVLVAVASIAVTAHVVPEKVEVAAGCSEPPAPESEVLTFRERGCIALCGGGEHVAWFARDDSYSYVCQCDRGAVVNSSAVHEL